VFSKVKKMDNIAEREETKANENGGVQKYDAAERAAMIKMRGGLFPRTRSFEILGRRWDGGAPIIRWRRKGRP